MCACISVQSVMCEFEPPPTHHVKITEQFHYRNPLGFPFTGTAISLPNHYLFTLFLKKKTLHILSFVILIESSFFRISREIKEQGISRVWMSYSSAAVQCKVDKEIFNYRHLISQIRDSIFPNPVTHSQALIISS